MEKENRVKWYKDGVGTCALTGYRTSWIAKTIHGSIRCFKEQTNPNLESVVWNRILTNLIEEDIRELKAKGFDY